jgi:hypothetical protein
MTKYIYLRPHVEKIDYILLLRIAWGKLLDLVKPLKGKLNNE